MFKIEKVAYSIEKTTDDTYEGTIYLWYSPEAESIETLRKIIKDLYPAQYPGDNFVFENKYMTWQIIERDLETVESVIKTLEDDSSQALLYTQSEFKGTKDFIDTKIKYFDCSAITSIEKYA